MKTLITYFPFELDELFLYVALMTIAKGSYKNLFNVTNSLRQGNFWCLNKRNCLSPSRYYLNFLNFFFSSQPNSFPCWHASSKYFRPLALSFLSSAIKPRSAVASVTPFFERMENHLSASSKSLGPPSPRAHISARLYIDIFCPTAAAFSKWARALNKPSFKNETQHPWLYGVEIMWSTLSFLIVFCPYENLFRGAIPQHAARSLIDAVYDRLQSFICYIIQAHSFGEVLAQ